MEQLHFPVMAHALQSVLDKQAKDYVTVRQIVQGLPARVRQQLGLVKSLSTADILKKLTPLLNESLQVYHSGASVYIGRRYAPTEFILRRLQRAPRVSPKQLGLGLPMSKKDYIAALNTLLEAGTLVCTFKENHTPVLRLAVSALPDQTVPETGADDRQAFYTAYNTVGQGRSFVRIHRLREALPWSRERFDRFLLTLLAEYTVELHGGDPSLLTAEDIRQSYTSADGTLYIALSWRGKT